MAQPAASSKTYLEELIRTADRVSHLSPSWVRDLRKHARTRFAEGGFPTTRDEDWRYTDVSAIERHGFLPQQKPVTVGPEAIEGLFKGLVAYRFVFVNGYFAADLSQTSGLPAGVTVDSFAAVLESRPETLEPHLDQQAGAHSNGFAALNTAFLADGAYIRVHKNAHVADPIHLVFLTTGEAEASLIQPRNLIVAEEGSQAIIVEHYVAVSDARYFTNAITEIVVNDNALIEHYRVQQQSTKAYHIGGLHAKLARDARFVSHAIDLGGLLVRNELRVELAATGGECTLNGLYVVDGRQHVDNHTHISHAQPRGISRQFYKGVLDGRARAVFNGRVVVHPDAQQTDAQQMNNNLLLSPDAEVDTKPALEIYADDVKCSHGATVGQLDIDALFYLRSRGMDESAARELLTYAFANDLLSRIRLAPIRTELEHMLVGRLLPGRALQGMELI